MKKVLLLYACIGSIVHIHGQTTIVYNVSTNTCSGTNMNCEGLVNSVGDLVVWDTSDSETVKHATFTTPKTVTLTVKDPKNPKVVHIFTPTTGAGKGKRIRVLFCLIPFNNTPKFALPDNVAADVKNIVKEQGADAPISSILKVYRQFTGNTTPPPVSEWVEVATLLIPKTSTGKQTITLNPDGTAIATAKKDSGEDVDLVIDLQKQY